MGRVFARRCSLARTLETVGEFWALLIVRDLWSFGPQRFDDLQQGLSISSRTLSTRLAHLTECGVLTRRRYQRAPDRYEYCLSRAGMDLVPSLMMLTAWGDRYFADAVGPTTLFRHRSAAHAARPIVVCADCGAELSIDSTHLEHGPGAGPAARAYLAPERTAAAHVVDAET